MNDAYPALSSASIVLALCGGRLLEFPAAQAAASLTAAWDRAENSGRWAGGGRTACASCTGQAAAPSASPVDLIDKAFTLAQECGGFEQVKRLVDRLAGA